MTTRRSRLARTRPRRQQRGGVGPHPREHIGMQPVRWNRAGILSAVGAGKQARQILRRIGGAVPDTIVAAPEPGPPSTG
jgi:hypothetical protein